MVKYKYTLGIFCACLLFTICLYPYLPNYLAVHWNESGEPNEFVTKQVVVFIIPFFVVLLYGLAYVVSHHIYKFNGDHHVIIMGFIRNVTVFILFIHMLILFINLENVISFQTGLTIGISVFLFMLSKGFKKRKEAEEEPMKLQKIRLFSRRIFQMMACIILFSLFLNLRWGFYFLISAISCGSILFMLCILYSYIIESYET
ncbi:DUF1648 domain-containing protein [Bacillus clarus]|uniref:DUF1648 domain-containing protein n=1 Tax=Bacillus clarus TaxID=2338372 RepID=A0A090Z067_9BACI|nr:DUF1648 domain-containing protein [Bacillus clarus]KFN04594.1 hypothetical protein DJ93_3761 [Bacillus clarus]RFT62364.1 DUF1648 domain-containing protein [Bacillus clarus]